MAICVCFLDLLPVRFEVHVCTAAQRYWALEAWRILDPRSLIFPADQRHLRIMNVEQHGLASQDESKKLARWVGNLNKRRVVPDGLDLCIPRRVRGHSERHRLIPDFSLPLQGRCALQSSSPVARNPPDHQFSTFD